MKDMTQQKVTHMIESAEGGAGLLHKITERASWRGGAQILKKEEQDARFLDRCEAKMKEWAKHRQCSESVRNLEDKPLKNEELKKLDEAFPRQKECDLEKASRLQEKTGVGCDGFHHNNHLGLDERNRKSNCGVTGKGGTKWNIGRSKLVQRCSF